MATFYKRKISDIFAGWLHVSGGLTATPQPLCDGVGNTSAARLSTAGLNLPSVDVASDPPQVDQLDVAPAPALDVGAGFVQVAGSCLTASNGEVWFMVEGVQAL